MLTLVSMRSPIACPHGTLGPEHPGRSYYEPGRRSRLAILSFFVVLQAWLTCADDSPMELHPWARHEWDGLDRRTRSIVVPETHESIWKNREAFKAVLVEPFRAHTEFKGMLTT